MSPATTTPGTGLMSADEFFTWSRRPENRDRHCELDNGRIVEIPPLGELHGVVCSMVAYLLWGYCYSRGTGRVTTNDTGIRVRPNTIQGADVMLFDIGRAVSDLHTGYPTDVPSLVVEVFFPSDQPGRLNRRIARYHSYGVPLVWVVYPEDFQVDVFRANQAVQSLDLGDTLQNFPELPGFSATVAALFTLPGQQPPTAAP